jgi:hypothetical protein
LHFDELIHALQHLSQKLALCYNCIQNIYNTLQILSRNGRFWATDAGELRTDIAMNGKELTSIQKMFKISIPLQGICSRRYIDPTKLIFVIVKAKTGFIDFKGWCPIKIKYKKINCLNSEERADD